METAMLSIEEIINRIKENHGQNTTSNPISYKCPRCHDLGLWERQRDDGYTEWVKCECQRVREAEQLLERSGLSAEIAEKKFKTFKVETEWQRAMYDTAIEYGKAYFEAKENGGKLPWFFIAGQPGCGKTHICTALCDVMLKKEIPVYYMQWITESRRLRAIVNDPAFDSMLWQYTDIDILYIDDLFKQQGHKDIIVTDAEVKVLFEILNARYIQNKATIISTEWFLEEELMNVDDGTFSRVYERSKGFTVTIGREKDRNYRISGKESA